ncbi:MAG: hypothetical protein HYY05_01515 [Chloroflexi bacterium]|nr:hypothetical protein [Chloroflexota bacterium]
MRTMLQVSVPVEKGNRALADGSLPRLVQGLLADLKPEAAYFFAAKGKRTFVAFFDLADPSQIPAIAEPLFMLLDAEVDYRPVMNAEDLAKGLGAAEQSVKKYS